MDTQTAIFGLGNFWEAQDVFRKVYGVTETLAGYVGGTHKNPTYHNMGDHIEAVCVEYDPRIISYEELLEHFWALADEVSVVEERATIFYIDDLQKEVAERNQAENHVACDVAILPVGKFYPAEQYHQHYLARLRGEAA
jgi:peptide-methionine (S)-S-oxide reductase